MSRKSIVLSVNAAWNVANFRLGLIKALQGAGHHVLAVAPEDESRALVEEAGVEFCHLAMDRKGVSPVADALLYARYVGLLKAIRPDVFLGFTIKPNIYGSLAAQAVGARVINNVSGLGTAFIRNSLLTPIVSNLYRIALRNSHKVFFQNADDQSLFLDRRLVAPERTGVLPGSGIDLRRFRPRDPVSRSSGEFVFLLIGRLLRDKGVVEYVEAARQIRRDRPRLRFQLLGFLDPENRTGLTRSDVESWVEEGTIEYLGPASDVRPAIAAADCIVLPSYREGLPRTLLEGAAMARPLVATDVPGCREIVRHGKTGFSCAARDGVSLAHAMLRMADLSPSERVEMGRRARAIVEAEYSEDLVIRRYLDAID